MVSSFLDIPSSISQNVLGPYFDSEAILSLRQWSKECLTIANGILKQRWNQLAATSPQKIQGISKQTPFECLKEFTKRCIQTMSISARLLTSVEEHTALQKKERKLQKRALKIICSIDVSGYTLKGSPEELRSELNKQQCRYRSGRYQGVGELYGRKLIVIPPEISQFYCLVELNLANNQLTKLPLQLFGLNRLKDLCLLGNQLTSLPSAISYLDDLQKLDLSYNRLHNLPNEICSLDTLRHLEVSHNKLTDLPTRISSLKLLKILDISHNQLTTLPATLTKLSILLSLAIQGNPLLFIEAEIVNSHRPIFAENEIIRNFSEELRYHPVLPLGQLYHALIQKKSSQVLQTLFARLSPEDKKLILEIAKKQEQTLFASPIDFCQAVRKAIETKYDCLSEEQQEELESDLTIDASSLGLSPSLNNLSLLADATQAQMVFSAVSSSISSPRPTKRQKTEE